MGPNIRTASYVLRRNMILKSADKICIILQAPWYNSNYAHQGEMSQMLNNFEPILYRSGVNAVFAGEPSEC